MDFLKQAGPLSPDEIARAVLSPEIVFSQLDEALRRDLAWQVAEAAVMYMDNADDRAAFVVAVRRMREQIDQARWRIDWWALAPTVRRSAIRQANRLIREAITTGQARRVRWDNEWVITTTA